MGLLQGCRDGEMGHTQQRLYGARGLDHCQGLAMPSIMQGLALNETGRAFKEFRIPVTRARQETRRHIRQGSAEFADRRKRGVIGDILDR